MEKHFICTGGCNGESNKPGTCQANACSRHGLELKECHCEDHKHWGLITSQKKSGRAVPTRLGLDASALGLSIGITLALLTFISGITASVFRFPIAPTFGEALLNSVAIAVAGLVIGAVVAWLYNAFRK